MSAGKVDVLAVMYRLAGNRGLSAGDCEDLLAAREAVEQLIFAARHGLAQMTTVPDRHGNSHPFRGKEHGHKLLTAALAKVQP